MLKKLSILAVVVIIIAVFTGCNQNANNDTLTILLKSSDAEKEYIQKLFELYQEKTGKTIKLIAPKNTDFYHTVDELFAKNQIPDLFLHYNDSVLEAYDVPSNFYYLNDEKWVNSLTDDVLANSKDSDGNVLGLPFWENSLSGFYYNKTIMDELGLSPAYNQAEFDALCAAIKSAGYTPLYWASNACNWMFQFGLDPIFADNPELLEKLNKNEIKYADIPQVRDMIEWLDKANKNGWFNTDYSYAEWDSIAPALANGDTVIIPVWDTWFDTNLNNINGKYTVNDFALMPVFLNTADNGTYEGGNMNLFLVNKNSTNLDLALDFLDFAADPETFNAAFDGVSTINSFKSQTTNIQSKMVTDAKQSIDAYRRVSTARPKIIGYRQDEVGDAIYQLFQGKLDVDGCIALMDEYRIKEAQNLGAEGF